ncbi:tyrosine-type recombinase/integrase [Paraburkholderia saeva]|uniref:tyrosine-type recombinase/integrase n=1 Tax=Paraburkholderia saeva TaxID=2777537 RepID=UPI001DCE3AF9|nr:site-specific integrase [Paraburkholderia saeva]CAG4926110.1 Tyrosine recombinase XerC [Paraburkholderia saeva]
MSAKPLKIVGASSRTAYEIAPVRAINAPDRRRIVFPELTEAYEAAYQGRDPSRAQIVRRWAQYFDGWITSEIDADAVADALEHWAATPVRRFVGKDESGAMLYRELDLPKPGSINKAKAVLSAVLTFAKNRRMMPKGWTNPCRDVPGLTMNNERVRFLDDGERKRLLAVCRLSTWNRLYLLVLMAITTGARKSELLRLRYADIDMERATAYVRLSKNDEPRMLPLTPAVLEEIRRFGKPKHRDALLFARVGDPDRPFTINRAWSTAVHDANLTDFKFHDLRHTCASYLAQNGASLLDVAATLGHKQLDVTRRYSHLTIDSKRAIVNRVMGEIA